MSIDGQPGRYLQPLRPWLVGLALLALLMLFLVDAPFEAQLENDRPTQRLLGIRVSLSTDQYQRLEFALIGSYILASAVAAAAIALGEKKPLDPGLLLLVAPFLIVLVARLAAAATPRSPEWVGLALSWSLPFPVLAAAVLETVRFFRARSPRPQPIGTER